MGGGKEWRGLGERNRPKFPGEGNYLGKSRRNFYISNRSFELLHRLSLEYGINHSNIIEIAVREMYSRVYGSVPKIKYLSGNEAE